MPDIKPEDVRRGTSSSRPVFKWAVEECIGERVNVRLNDQQVYSNLTLENRPGTVYHAAVSSGSSTFRAEALNQGTVGPNIASPYRSAM